jgi:hypothetical protein
MKNDTVRNETRMPRQASALDLLRLAFTVVGVAACALCASVGFAQTQPETDPDAPVPVSIGRVAPASTGTRAKAIPPTTGKHHPHATAEVPMNKDALAAKLSNPSAPILSFRTFLDTTTYRGEAAPGIATWGFSMETQPAFPVFVGPAALIFRPTIILEFGQPYVDSGGNVRKFNGIGNWQLDTLYGKTLKNGLMVMGGVSTQFPSATKKEVRQDWGFGPEALLGYAKGNVVFGMLASYTWQFPQESSLNLKKQTVSGQYFYGINLGNAWQLSACPTWEYDRDTKQFTFPLGLGIMKMVVFPKRQKPMQVGVSLWNYVAQDDTLGPTWTLRVTFVPVASIPWQKKVQREMAAEASASMARPPRF